MKTSWIIETGFLQAAGPSCCQTNGI